MLLVLALACARPAVPLEPAGLASCGYTATIEHWEPADPSTCTGSYDAAGNDLGLRCVSESGLRRDYLTEWDGACVTGGHWYVEFPADIGGGSYEWIATFTCDAHANEAGGSDRQIQLADDGEVLEDLEQTWTVENTYEDDLLVRAVTSGDWNLVRDLAYTPEGWLAEETSDDGTGAWFTRYEHDARGNVTHDESGRVDEAPDYEVWSIWDPWSRLVATETSSYDGDETTTTWSGRAYTDATQRFTEERFDLGDGGDLDAVDTWEWDCP